MHRSRRLLAAASFLIVSRDEIPRSAPSVNRPDRTTSAFSRPVVQRPLQPFAVPADLIDRTHAQDVRMVKEMNLRGRSGLLAVMSLAPVTWACGGSGASNFGLEMVVDAVADTVIVRRAE